MDQLPAVINEALVDLNTALPRLIKGRDIGIDLLKGITKVTKESRQTVVDALSENKKVSEKINGIRMPITKRLDELKASIMQYEKASMAEHDRVRGLVEAFDQIELEITRKAQAKAARELEITTYKATIKESVGKQVVGMLGGQVRNIIDGMAKWEAALTVENIDKKGADLATRQLQLKRDEYDKCFLLDFPGKRKDLLTDEEFAAFMESLKVEYSYEKQNEIFLQGVSPIINEYRAKLPDIKKQLAAIKAGPTAAELEAKRKKDIEEEAWAKLTANSAETAAKVEEVTHTKDKEVMEGEFVRQGVLEGMETGPVEYIAEFADINENRWLKPFLEVVAKCGTHPKFKLVKDKKAEYVTPVEWWLSFYGKNFTEAPAGIKMKEVAKTIVRRSKEDF